MNKYSIIVPVFNGEAYVQECTLSLLGQTGAASFEVLIVDDCSTDSTPALLAQLAETDKRVRIFRTERNSGPRIARHVGLDHAAGDFVMFVDSDDKLLPDAIARLDEQVASQPTLDVIGFNWRYDSASTVETGRSGGRYDFHSLV